MPCVKPLLAWKSNNWDDYDSKTGKGKMVFASQLGIPGSELELPCGQCIGCRLDRARSWAVRCMHEASLHKTNCFLTLTYTDEKLPPLHSLRKRDLQLFTKRLRKAHPELTIRYLQCGEYGDISNRPHYHVLLFNYDFPDKVVFSRKNGNTLYLSTELSFLWPHGLHSIGELTFDSACYVSRYVLKKVTGKNAEDHYNGRTPEFITMSLKPAIGRQWYDKFKDDIYNYDKCVVRHNFITRPPKYYDRLYDLDNPQHFNTLKRQRVINAKNNSENSPDRRATREKLLTIKQEKLLRDPQK